MDNYCDISDRFQFRLCDIVSDGRYTENAVLITWLRHVTETVFSRAAKIFVWGHMQFSSFSSDAFCY